MSEHPQRPPPSHQPVGSAQPLEAVRAAEAANAHAEPPRRPRHRPRRAWKPSWARRDLGRFVARLLCVGFAIVGVVPLALGLLTRLDSVQNWTAEETAALLHDQLGVAASYDLQLQPWPLQVTMRNVVVDASDGGSPFLQARQVVARPRLFSLLAGKLDFGEVHIEEPRVRVVVRDGKIQNLRYALPPEPKAEPEELPELPLSAVAITNARVDLALEDLGLGLRAREMDVDVWVERGSMEVSLRAGQSELDHAHAMPARPEELSVDEDVLCRLDLRARLEANRIQLRRLRLQGSLDFDPAPGTRPSCRLADEDWRKLMLRLETISVNLKKADPESVDDNVMARLPVNLTEGGLDSINGRVMFRVPAAVAHRLAPVAPTAGWLLADVEAHYDGSMRLPALMGRFAGRDLGIDSKVLASAIMGDVDTSGDKVQVSKVTLGWAGGTTRVDKIVIDPFAEGITLRATGIDIEELDFPDMLNDLAAHPHSHVAWTFERARLEHFGGTLDPLELSGPIRCVTRDFAVYDRPSIDPKAYKIMGVSRATLNGTYMVTPTAVVLSNMDILPPRSQLRATVSLGFEEDLAIHVAAGSTINLADISPLVDISLDGIAKVEVHGYGTFNEPVIEGDLAVSDFVFGGFPLGHVERSRVQFVPVVLDLSDGQLLKGQSVLAIPKMRVDFDAGADVVLEADVDTRTPAGLLLTDFFNMVKFDEDPRFSDLQAVARGVARVDYVLAGPRDRCGGGRLQVRGQMDLSKAELWGEKYDSGFLDVDFLWNDMAAGDRGLDIDLNSAVLRKGPGTILARGTVRHGGILRADATATAIPLSEFTALESLYAEAGQGESAGQSSPSGAQTSQALTRLTVRPEADVSFVAEIGGTLSRPEVKADVDMSPMRIGPDVLPASRFQVFMEPADTPVESIGLTRCGNERTAPFDLARWQSDPVEGVIRLKGSLFGKQITFDDLQVTQQRAKIASGELWLRGLDLGALANLIPDVAFSSSPPSGRLDADVLIEELPLDEPALAEIAVKLHGLQLGRYGHTLKIPEVQEPLRISGDALYIPEMPLFATFGGDLELRLRAGGAMRHLSRTPELDLSFQLDRTDLSSLGLQMPDVASAAGIVWGQIEVGGTTKTPTLQGDLKLADGALSLKHFPVSFEDIEIDVQIIPGEIRVQKATARAGTTGRVSLQAHLPMRGFELTGASATLAATGLNLPVADGVRMTADAMLNATYQPALDGSDKSPPPHVTGTVSLTSFTYTRPISFQLDIDQLTGRGPTEVETYNPADDVVTFDLNLVSPAPLTIANNLLDMQIDVRQPGLRLMGTNQRFGALGTLQVTTGSKLFLLGHHFTIRDGYITFDSTTRIAPRLDIHATTEYRRYSRTAQIDPAAASAAEAGTAGSTAGKWRIAMYVSGDTDEPKIRFSSDPPLSQEDIILLLQVGMTRAELDRGMVGSLAQSVGLEALTAATGFDQAVRSTVPLIDEFRIGSQYSSRTGRTEPTATVGKRVTDDIRATVTTGLTDNREVRSRVEWQLTRGISLEGSYDNVNDVASSGLGNIGADIRWRLEFE